ncbi:MAG: bifunctional serine/threonine-protein kinase/formylglycine-generating enzyme family protein [Candidatus Eremiobacteraeota bacterium]|nr:bifunctional serine/threonine-protein kinase/formylglycine-generating enzyme family protein [Candidatus Eremiobacteraeota bacterium]
MSKLCPFCQKTNRTAANFCHNCGGVLDSLCQAVNTVLDRRYRIVSHIKKGGMANVYKAEDQRLGKRICAVKEMIEPYDNEEMQEKFSEWFEREMQILSSLRHPGIPVVWDYFIHSGRYYLVLEYIEGKNLEDLLGEQPGGLFPESTVMKWGCEIADILEHLHIQNPPVIHRDIKPSNIIFKTDGKLMLIDFGIAKLFSPVGTGTRIGTLGFIAPEHYKGHPEPRSDLFSLGVTLYQLLTGIDPSKEVPYNFTPMRKKKPDISDKAVTMVNRLIALNMDERFGSARELKDYLTIGGQGGAQSIALQIISSATSMFPGAPSPPSSPPQPASALSSEPPPSQGASPRIELKSTMSDNEARKKIEIDEAPPAISEGSSRHIFTTGPKTQQKSVECTLGRDQSRMVLIPGGAFMMGAALDDESYFYERPSHSVTVGTYYIDKFPVTVKQFLLFLEETRYPFKNRDIMSERLSNHPVVNVSWHDACAYAAWAGKRLPTEAEWEKAARGVDGRKYPWGDEWRYNRLNCTLSGARGTTAVGSYLRGVSPFGCHDMLGNVWELTLDNISGYPYKGPSPQKAEIIAIRGGSWKSAKRECRCTSRERILPSFSNIYTGFRCAISVL